jgi:hypothetical protein
MEKGHTSTRAIVDDDTIAIFQSFLLCDNFCSIEEQAKYLYVSLFCLGT